MIHERRSASACEAHLREKYNAIARDFAPSLAPGTSIDVEPSPFRSFRSRVRVQVIHRANDEVTYARWTPDESIEIDIDDSIEMEHAISSVSRVMRELLREMNARHALREGVAAAHFLGDAAGESVLATLVYSRAMDEERWLEDAREIASKEFAGVRLSLLGRSKGRTLVVGEAFVLERYTLADGRVLKYKHVEGAFSNPNATITEKTMDFLCACASEVITRSNARAKLLELYCGNANHTCALAAIFDSIVAVEINPTLVSAARESLAMNGVTNAEVVLGDSRDAARRLMGGKFRRADSRLVSIENFDAVLVDPPRAGLDSDTLKLVSMFKYVLYVSCGPNAMLENMRDGLNGHVIERMVVLDHFPYTRHIEVACLFRRLDS